jgi:hypothetical protein
MTRAGAPGRGKRSLDLASRSDPYDPDVLAFEQGLVDGEWGRAPHQDMGVGKQPEGGQKIKPGGAHGQLDIFLLPARQCLDVHSLFKTQRGYNFSSPPGPLLGVGKDLYQVAILPYPKPR